MSRVEGALKAAGLPPLAWYEALVELDRAGACGLRPFALEEALRLPQYGLSRLLARMEAAGLVVRGSCPEDGRGQMVALTEAGRAMLGRMQRVHAARCRRRSAPGCHRRRRRGSPSCSAGSPRRGDGPDGEPARRRLHCRK